MDWFKWFNAPELASALQASAREEAGGAEFLGALTRQATTRRRLPTSTSDGHPNNMENPHAERQAVLLERIVKNAVSVTPLHPKKRTITSFLHRQDKCTELILELNHCVEVCHDVHHASQRTTRLTTGT